MNLNRSTKIIVGLILLGAMGTFAMGRFGGFDTACAKESEREPAEARKVDDKDFISAVLNFPIESFKVCPRENESYDDLVKKQRQKFRLHRLLIKSGMVIHSALNRPGIANLPKLQKLGSDGLDQMQWLKSVVVVDLPDDSEILCIRIPFKAVGGDRRQTAKLVNAVADAYMEKVVDEERNLLLAQRDRLDRSHTKRVEIINTKNTNYHNLARRVGHPGATSSLVTKHLINTLEIHRDALRDLLRDQLEAQLKIVRFNIKHPKVKVDSKSKTTAENSIEANSLEQQLRDLRLEEKKAAAETNLVRDRYTTIAEQIRELTEYSPELGQRKRELDRLTKFTSEIGERLERIDLALAVEEDTTIQMLMRASP